MNSSLVQAASLRHRSRPTLYRYVIPMRTTRTSRLRTSLTPVKLYILIRSSSNTSYGAALVAKSPDRLAATRLVRERNETDLSGPIVIFTNAASDQVLVPMVRWSASTALITVIVSKGRSNILRFVKGVQILCPNCNSGDIPCISI